MPRPTTAIPVMRGWPIVGMLPALRRDVPGLLASAHARHGDVVRLAAPGRRAIVSVAHPDAVRHVLVAANARYGRSPFHARLEPALGKGLFTSDPPLWTRQRRLIQPAFQAQPLQSYTPIIAAAAERLAARWAAAEGGHVDASTDLAELALAIVAETLFGRRADHGDLTAAVEEARLILAARMFALWTPPSWLPTRGRHRLHRALGRLDAAVDRIITAADDAEPSVVGQLHRAALERRQLRDEVMTLFLAGHETSAAALAWALWLLGTRPALQARIARESGDLDLAGLDDVGGALPFTRAVVHETLRLYPPGAWSARAAREPDAIGGHRIAAGDIVIVAPFVTQRDARWWTEPLEFRPERFLAPGFKPRPGTWFPFGAGPRTCIGLQFALNEMILTLAALLRAVEVTAIAPERVRPHSAITLRPEPGVTLAVAARARDPAAARTRTQSAST